MLLLLAGSNSTTWAADEAAVEAGRLKGIEYLKSKQETDGSWVYEGHSVGITALCTLALIENGVPLYDPVVDKGYKRVRKGVDGELKQTYDLTLAALLLARVGDRADKALIRTIGARLLAGQLESGGWSYTCPAVDATSLASSARGTKRKAGDGDNSCTQFGVLGLWVCSRYGVSIDEAMQLVAARFVDSQNEDGGWTYNPKGTKTDSTGSMTSAGLFCLTVARATKIRQELQKAPGVRGSATAKGAEKATLLGDPIYSKGFTQVGYYAKSMSPGSARYFMWSVERLGVLLGLEKLGDVKWFDQGSTALLKSQKPDGSWPDSKESPADTAFAILFLRKANLGSDISRLLEGEPEQAFCIPAREGTPRFATLQEAIASAQPGETIRIDGNGPYRCQNDLFKQDLTLTAGFGYAPVLEYAVGYDATGLRYRPERDAVAQALFTVESGTVTLEGLRLQMDPPAGSNTIPWRILQVNGGKLRLLNCSLSEGTKRGIVAISSNGTGEIVIKNSLLSTSATAIQLNMTGDESVTIDNSVIFATKGIDVAGKGTLSLLLSASAIHTAEGITAEKFTGEIHSKAMHCVFKCDSLGSTFLTADASNTGRTWEGRNNVYNVGKWVGAKGKPAVQVKDPASFSKFFDGGDVDPSKLTISFVNSRRPGTSSHGLNSQEWDLSEKSELAFSAKKYGILAAVAGPGGGFSRFREEISYNQWVKGETPLSVAELEPLAKN
jgi:hypothetical protein